MRCPLPSNVPSKGDAQLKQLRRHLEVIHDHFEVLYELDAGLFEQAGRHGRPADPGCYGRVRATSSAGSPRALTAIAMYCLPSIM